MGIQIEGGRGNGYSAGVNNDNRLIVEAISSSVEHHTNHKNGEAFNLLFTATPTGGLCFLYIKNTNDTDMCLEGFTLHLVQSEYIDIKIGDTGTPVGGNDITPANLNSGSGIIATGTFQNSADITEISGGRTVDRIYHLTGAGQSNYNFEQDIILKKNGVLTMYAQTGEVALSGVLIFNYHHFES